ncbi:MAG TPA: hypothetical protein VM285_15425, partial [Polyangia bacterium]|nr:hypothetical protein [Polyangia bacterium]
MAHDASFVLGQLSVAKRCFAPFRRCAQPIEPANGGFVPGAGALSMDPFVDRKPEERTVFLPSSLGSNRKIYVAKRTIIVNIAR